MRELVCNAIANKRLIRFMYKDDLRIAEPHCCGKNSKGIDLLRAYQTRGGSNSDEMGWKLFTLDKMENLALLDETFDGPRPDYVRGDSQMQFIYQQL